MAITFQAALDQVTNTTPTAFNVGAGSNRYLIVFVLKQSSQTCTGVAYNGVAMTNLATIATNNNVSTNEQTTIWGLINPTSGSNNIDMTFSGAGTFACWAVCYNGVDQTTGFHNPNTVSSASANSISITTDVTDWAVAFFRTSGGLLTASGGTTLRGTNAGSQFGDSNGAIGSSPYSLGFTSAVGVNLLGGGLIPAGAGAGAQNNWLLMGV